MVISCEHGKRVRSLSTLRRFLVDIRQYTRVRHLELQRVKIPRPRQTVYQMPALR
jgi:hypothetical protein